MSSAHPAASATDRLGRLIGCRAGELIPALWSFAYFFFLLGGYYMIRPIRDEMGILGGVERLHVQFGYTFLATLLVVPFFGYLTARLRRRVFLPLIYGFVILNLLVFFAVFRYVDAPATTARVFFVWLSVFNIFIISVFWSFMVDLFDREQSVRLFGFVAAGGSAGALCGPLATATLAPVIGTVNILPIAAVVLTGAVVCIQRLIAWSDAEWRGPGAATDDAGPAGDRHHEAMGGSIVEGIGRIWRSRYLQGICLLIFLLTLVATVIYLQQAYIVRDLFDDSAERTRVFSLLDFVVNGLTVVTQLFFTGRITRRIGLARTLVVLPAFMTVGFLALGIAPVFAVLAVVQVLRRSTNYAVMKPAREMLYTVLQPVDKYKAKNVIDTVIYRGGDWVNATAINGLIAAGVSLGAVAFMAVPIAAAWGYVAWRMGRAQQDFPDTAPDRQAAAPTRPGLSGASR